MPETVISPMAAHSFGEIFSPKSTKAISAVAAISKLPSSDAPDAEPSLMPNIMQIGAAISSRIIPIVYGRSFFVNRSSSRSFLHRKSVRIPTPTPAPRQRSDAMKVGGTDLRRSLETGVFSA